MNLETDQLILEFYTPGEPNSGWIHCSWIPEGRREQYMHAYKSEGKTKYKPIIESERYNIIMKDIAVVDDFFDEKELNILVSNLNRIQLKHGKNDSGTALGFFPQF